MKSEENREQRNEERGEEGENVREGKKEGNPETKGEQRYETRLGSVAESAIKLRKEVSSRLQKTGASVHVNAEIS